MLKINYNITYKTTTVKVNSKMIPDFMNPVTFWSGHHLNDIKRVLQFVFHIDMKLKLSKTFKNRLGTNKSHS